MPSTRSQSLIWAGLKAVWLLLAGTFLTSLIGGASTAIFSIAHFHQFTTYGLAANLAAMPLISFVIMPAALAGMIAMPFGLDAPFFAVMGYGLEWVIVIAKAVASWGGEVSFGRKHDLFLPLASAGFILLVLSKTGLRWIGIMVIVAALAVDRMAPAPKTPDLLISEDGSLLALLHDGKAYVNRPRPSDFLYRQWQSVHPIRETITPQKAELVRLGATDAKAPPAASAAETEAAADAPYRRAPLASEELQEARKVFALYFSRRDGPRFHCQTSLACLSVTGEGTRILVLQDARYVGPACDEADLVVAPTSRLAACRSGAILITGEHLRRTGAVELSLAADGRDRTSWSLTPSFTGETRPWQIHRAYSWRSGQDDNHVPPHLLRLINDNDG